MKFDKNDTAVVMIDPQNEVLSETGLGWPLLRESLHENNAVENMERIFKAAKEFGFEIFISPHYFYPTDKGWKFNGALEVWRCERSLRGPKPCPVAACALHGAFHTRSGRRRHLRKRAGSFAGK